jgi:hypothetical protein
LGTGELDFDRVFLEVKGLEPVIGFNLKGYGIESADGRIVDDMSHRRPKDNQSH